MKPVRKTRQRSVYDGVDEAPEFLAWLSKEMAKLSPSELETAKMAIGRGSSVTMVGITYTEDAPLPPSHHPNDVSS